MNKSGKIGFFEVFIMVAVGMVVLNMGGYDVPGFDQTPDAPDVDYCADPSVTYTHGSLNKFGDPATAITAANCAWWKNGIMQSLTETCSTGTDTVAYGDEITEILGYNSATYYAQKVSGKVPCTPFSSSDWGVTELVDHGDIVFTCQSRDSGNVNAEGTQNETIVASGKGNFDNCRISIAATYEGTSPHGNILMVVEVNKSNYDTSKFLLDGKAPDATSKIPQGYVRGMDGGASQLVAWEIKGCPDLSAGETLCDKTIGTLSVEAKSSGTMTYAGRAVINVTWINEDYDLHTINYNNLKNSDAIIFGYEDDVGTLSGFAQVKDSLYVGTGF